MSQSRTWSVFDAKARFSEVVDLAVKRGPQIVTKHGEPTVVILAIEEYEALRRPRPSFKEFLCSGPLAEVPLERIEGGEREIDL